ncbi:MAG: PAS domain-containing protein [Parachlamydiales bacterium]|nr:PAS domain-containing protein [Parachlamydiales bacterium]
MSDIFKKLQESANLAMKSTSSDESMKHLANAFSLFSKEAKRIENSYKTLQDRFLKVSSILEKKEKDLTHKITDLNSITSYLNNILSNISQGILFIDLDGIITTFNSPAEKILEKKQDEILFQSYFDCFNDDFFGFSMKDAIKLKQTKKLNYIFFKKNEKEIEVTTSFVYDCPSRYQGIIIMLKDMTKLKKLEVLANRNDRLNHLGEMAASVAHEIKNPLGVIRGYASLLHNDLKDNKTLQTMTSYILDGTRSLERVVNNVLEYARPVSLTVVSSNITKLIKELIKDISIDPTFSKNVKIDLHLADTDTMLPMDKDLIKSAFLNLIVNAYQAIEEIGTLNISTYKNNDYFIININDTGTGIEEKDLENVFSPFFTTKQYGNGLGLSQTHKIIQAHFGTIEVRSIVNKGTTFCISLPIKR